MRKTRRQFAEKYVEEILSGKEQDQAMLDAGHGLGWAGSGPLTDGSILRKAKAMLQNPDVAAAIREKIELTTGFTTAEADNWLVRHIRGEITVEEGKVPPSIKALEMYKRSTEPQPTKTVNVNQRSLVARITIGDDPPAIKPRAIEP